MSFEKKKVFQQWATQITTAEMMGSLQQMAAKTAPPYYYGTAP